MRSNRSSAPVAASADATKIGTSCAECRRSKLKCDRSFPCQSCIRRGCANICPDGTMPATKGNKALVVRAQKLTEEVDELKSRIHELEAALENARLNDPTATSAHGYQYHGSPSLSPIEPGPSAASSQGLPRLSSAINDLVSAFPLGQKNHSYSSNPVSSEELLRDILANLYPSGEDPFLADMVSHKLSVFFATIALGILCDRGDDAKMKSEHYHNLARAALSFESLSTTASCATIQAIFLVTRLTQKAHSCVSEECWLLNGINNRLIHKLGLHHEGYASSVEERQRQAARRAFWEVVSWDAWACFISDRPGYFSLKHVNWSIWRYKFTTCCVTLTLDYTLSYRDPPYSAIIDVDHKIRAFPLPTEVPAQAMQTGGSTEWSSDAFTAAQEFATLSVVEATLICLHKKYFIQAMCLDPNDPFSTEYQVSARTTLHSASRIINGMIKLYQQHARELNLTWFLWAPVFISTNVLRDLTIRCPRCPVSKNALQLYEKAMALYEDAMAGISEGPLAKLRAFYGKACVAVSMADNFPNPVMQTPVLHSALTVPESSGLGARSQRRYPSPMDTLRSQTPHHGFQEDQPSTSWMVPHSTNTATVNLLPESVYDSSIYVPESEFGYQQRWDASQQWEDFVAEFRVPDHELLDRSK
ncbi:hypothetical protein CVT24_006768 [Panaeolus cyanescens]|uniref:Zn(2)-C6 fungal-type domain-containing protein n=1 Tax=Panaeolus cyanescens TaxID=181874 RepID=A0A409V9E4_9AGAR|nr:hypothetical protein CVT24_006768 [Panaeolus cyanescens]